MTVRALHLLIFEVLQFPVEGGEGRGGECELDEGRRDRYTVLPLPLRLGCACETDHEGRDTAVKTM